MYFNYGWFIYVIYCLIGVIIITVGIPIFNIVSFYLSEYFNNSIVVNSHLNDVYYAVSYWTERGGRPYQEDRYTMLKGLGHYDSSLYGLFDGHGGSKASQYCKDNLLKYVKSDTCFKENTAASLMSGFRRLDEEFTQIAKRHMLSDGSTAVVAVINNKKVYVANAGDSRAIIVQKGVPIFMLYHIIVLFLYL